VDLRDTEADRHTSCQIF